MRFAKTLWARRFKQAERPGRFVLQYTPPGEPSVTVGVLEFEGGVWAFSYSEAYKRRSDLRPIEGFDDVQRVYRSSALFPFFAVRIPDVDRKDVQLRLKADRIRDPEATDLLRLFGRRTVSSPAFELLPAL